MQEDYQECFFCKYVRDVSSVISVKVNYEAATLQKQEEL